MATMLDERATNFIFYYIAYLVFNILKVSASTLVSEIGCPG